MKFIKFKLGIPLIFTDKMLTDINKLSNKMCKKRDAFIEDLVSCHLQAILSDIEMEDFVLLYKSVNLSKEEKCLKIENKTNCEQKLQEI